jgi:hypothetical protein
MVRVLLLLPKIADPTVLKLVLEVPALANPPGSTYVYPMVIPPPEAAPVPAPDATPPAEPKKLVAVLEPPPKFVAAPELDPVPPSRPPFINTPVPVDPLLMAIAPLPLAVPPVAPVETGMTVVVNVGSVEPPLEPLFLPPPEAGMPGIVVVTVLNCTGLKPAPKPPLPFESVVPSNESFPIPVSAFAAPL